jgi:DNA-binding XRE family transcriptional regulator
MLSMTQRVQPVKRDEGDKPLTFDPALLKRRRFAAGLTVRALARRANVAIGTISMLENGKRAPGVVTLAAVAHGLGCEITDLMPDEHGPRCDDCGYLMIRCACHPSRAGAA